MIKVDKDSTSINGTLPDITTEVVIMLRHFNAICVERLGETEGTSFYEKALSVASMDDQELKKEKKRVTESILKKIFGIED